MANDWIKMRADLQTHPKVFRIMSALNADVCPHGVRTVSDKYRIIGALHAVWCLFDAHSDDGVLVGYSAEILDSSLGIPGFARAMEMVKWLVIESDGVIKMPEFDTHNGASAKRRAKETDRKRKERLSENVRKMSAKCPQTMRTKSGLEKRREDIKNTPLPPTGECDEKRTPKTTGQEGYPADFEAAWKVYPRKDGKRKAFQAWQKAIKRGMPVADMPAHIDARAYEPDWLKDDGRYVPHMASWLNADGWLDEGAALPTPRPPDDDDDFWAVDFWGNPLTPKAEPEVRS